VTVGSVYIKDLLKEMARFFLFHFMRKRKKKRMSVSLLVIPLCKLVARAYTTGGLRINGISLKLFFSSGCAGLYYWPAALSSTRWRITTKILHEIRWNRYFFLKKKKDAITRDQYISSSLFLYLTPARRKIALSVMCVVVYFPLRLFLDSIGFLSVVVYTVEHIFLCWPRERKIRKS
jgi:hypothetical protein